MSLFRGSLLAPPDRLLWWASEVGSDRWVRWRETCLAVGLEPTSAARWFSALGHVEFDWVGRRFTTFPAGLAPLVPGGRTWHFRGARRRDLHEALTRAYRRDRGSVTWIAADDRGPGRWYFTGSMAAARTLADEVDVDLGSAATERPRHADWADGTTVDTMSDEQREQLKPWGDLRISERGLFKRRQMGVVEGWVHRRDGTWWRAPCWQLAPFMAVAERPAFAYDSERGALRVPHLFSPPAEHERLLVLQSGMVPIEVGLGGWPERSMEYRVIPERVAREVAGALRARLVATTLRNEGMSS